MHFLLTEFLFVVAFFLTLFLPGWFLLCATCKKHFTTFEIIILAVPLSFTMTTLLTLILGKSGFILSAYHLWFITLTLNAILGVWCFFATKKTPCHTQKSPWTPSQHILITALLLLMILTKTLFLTHTIFPTATDLGHHMFWVEKIVATQTLPTYEKIPVIPDDPQNAITQPAHFGAPQHIADFIVGEHIIFALLRTLSSQHVVSAFPSLILYLCNLATTVLLFLLARRLFAPLRIGPRSAIFVLLLSGPLYAISGAGAKFVSGGVIGNVIGNMLLIALLYFLYRALVERHRTFVLFSILIGMALIYTHHLSTFILLYILVATMSLLILFSLHALVKHLLRWRQLFFAPMTMLFIVMSGIFLFLHPPSYLNTQAISSSVGAPVKSTRTGIPFEQLMVMSGQARFVLALGGGIVVLLCGGLWRRMRPLRRLCTTTSLASLTPEARALLLGWFSVLLAMSTLPQLLHVNIISTRIATYIAFPSALLGGLFLGYLFALLPKALPRTLAHGILVLILLFVFTNGMRDNLTSLTPEPKTRSAVQTFHLATVLSETLPQDQWIIKDHNYITADTWIKVFIHRDYSNPLSRSFFKRYETRPHREHCTREMISHPQSDMARRCFAQLSIGPVVVNTAQDAQQFLDDPTFIKVYENNDTSIFWHYPYDQQ